MANYVFSCVATYSLLMIFVSWSHCADSEIRSTYFVPDRKSRALPCPEPEVIFPCTCITPHTGSVNSYRMTMNCTAVENEEQLRSVFNQPFPFSDFYKLTILGNEALSSILEGTLGEATFKSIRIIAGSVIEVAPNALIQSSMLVSDIDLSFNSLVTFPFDEIKFYEQLLVFDIGHNYIEQLHLLKSSSLEVLYLSGNPLTSFEPQTFDHLTNIHVIDCTDTQLVEVLPETFSNVPELSILRLGQNYLTSLPEGAIRLHGNDSQLSLSQNEISNVSAGAITGEINSIYIDNNKLYELLEEVWKPIMENMTGIIDARENPLMCGCEIAWLILNPELMAKLSGLEACSDGELLKDLDPEIYEELC